jgi:hypothetical protein
LIVVAAVLPDEHVDGDVHCLGRDAPLPHVQQLLGLAEVIVGEHDDGTFVQGRRVLFLCSRENSHQR